MIAKESKEIKNSNYENNQVKKRISKDQKNQKIPNEEKKQINLMKPKNP